MRKRRERKAGSTKINDKSNDLKGDLILISY